MFHFRKVATIFIVFLLFCTVSLVRVESVSAQCSGSATCCNEQTTTYTPSGCTPGCDPLTGCTPCTGSTTNCTSTSIEGCYGNSAASCGHNACIYGRISGGCNWTSAPGPTPTTPPSGGSCSGDCFSGISNCGEVGRSGGSGSCSGGALCCAAPGGGGGNPSFGCDLRPNNGGLSATNEVGNIDSIGMYIWDMEGIFEYMRFTALDPSVLILSRNDGANQSAVKTGYNDTYNGSNGLMLSSGTGRVRIQVFARRCPACGLEVACQRTISTVVSASCTPTCTGNLCGQSDGCGGLCADTDNQAPATPTLTSPADGDIIASVESGSDYIVPLVITPNSSSANNDFIQLEIYPTGTSCADPDASCVTIPTSSPTTTYNFTIPASRYGDHADFQWRAWHQSSLCTQPLSTASAWQYFTVGDEITGQVLLDDGIAGLSGGKCISPFAPVPITVSGSEQITVSRNGVDYTASLNGDATYSILAPVSNSGQNSLSFSTGGADSCGCPDGCLYSGVISPDTDMNIYYQLERDPWWQTIGGHIFAGRQTGYALTTLIPDTCIGGCLPYLSLRDGDDTVDSSGAVMTGGGAIDTSGETGDQANNLDEDAKNLSVIGASFTGFIENYGYFYRLFSMGLSPATDFNTPTDAVEPSAPPANGRAYYAPANLTIIQPWTVTAGESYTIFINGNLTIENTIDVANGGFLSFIVNGNIFIDPSVCTSGIGDTNGVVEGVYIANGVINIQSTGAGDCRFVGEGSFVGWTGVTMGRDFRDGATQDGWNSANPTELFRYRPDFVLNSPERMKRPLYQWQEVAPSGSDDGER